MMLTYDMSYFSHDVHEITTDWYHRYGETSQPYSYWPTPIEQIKLVHPFFQPVFKAINLLKQLNRTMNTKTYI